MRMSMQMSRPAVPLLRLPVSSMLNMEVFNIPRRPREKIIFVMGATGTGKSRLSIDLACRFPAEIINSDKIQVHKGLDIVTNKVPIEEQCGIPHHLLGIVNPTVDFTKNDFCRMASHAVQSILSRRKIPIVVGGSNSYIEALVDEYGPQTHAPKGLISKYDCCFLWVDVSTSVLQRFLSHRVDKMVEAGMVDELREFFDPDVGVDDYSYGIRKAIGVSELDKYLRTERFLLDHENRARLLNEAMDEVKGNTWRLAIRQVKKIHRLRNIRGWNLHRLDATPVFQKHMWNANAATNEAWHDLVTKPSNQIVGQFLDSYSSASAAFPARATALTCSAVGKTRAAVVTTL